MVPNLGSLFYFIVLSPLFFIALAILIKLCKRLQLKNLQSVKNFLSQLQQDSFFNGILNFLGQSSLILIVNSNINISSALKGEVNYNANFVISVCVFGMYFLYLLTLCYIFYNVKSKGKDKQFQQRFGSVYKDLNVEKIGFWAILYHVGALLRQVIRSYVLIQLREISFLQLIGLYSIVILWILFLEYGRFFVEERPKVLEVLDSAIILVVNYHLTCSTDFVEDY